MRRSIVPRAYINHRFPAQRASVVPAHWKRDAASQNETLSCIHNISRLILYNSVKIVKLEIHRGIAAADSKRTLTVNFVNFLKSMLTWTVNTYVELL